MTESPAVGEYSPDSGGAGEPGQPQVRLRGVSKRFGPVQALDGVDFDLRIGQIHALVGENGAGKSTLMRVLAGHMSAEEGTLTVAATQTDLTTHTDGFRQGVGFVEQEGGLVAELSGAENLLLASPSGFVADRGRAASQLRTLAERFGGAIEVRLPVQALAIGQRQRLEILIVMAQGAQVLILDEPTSALGTEEVLALRDIVRQFAREGGSVVYISHKLDEVVEMADAITVMRRGQVVGHHESGGVTVEQLAIEMVGEMKSSAVDHKQEELLDVALGIRSHADEGLHTRTVCSLRGIGAAAPFPGESSLKGLDLDIHAGEVVGIAGVLGSGQTTLAEVLAGFIAVDAGTMQMSDGRTVGYIPENRHRDAVALDLSLVDNMLLISYRERRFSKAGAWFNMNVVRDHVTALLQGSRVRYDDCQQPMRGLSGGNQQKAVAGRELEQSPPLLVAHNPFRGLDVRAISEVQEAILDAAHAGAGVVFLSPDISELRQVSHRIAVMFDGRIVGEIAPDDHDAERLGRLMGGAG